MIFRRGVCGVCGAKPRGHICPWAGGSYFSRSGDQKPACGDPGANPATNRGGRVRQLIGLGRLPHRWDAARLSLVPLFERVAGGAGCFYLAGGAGVANIGAAWQRVRWLEQGGLCAVAREPKTALTAARGFCKLRKSWSKVRFRSETKPGRRRSAPDPKTKFLSLIP